MSLLKKLLSSNLTKYEEEQKRRYKKYVKIKKQEAKVIEKSEAELYEDSLERQKSLRASRRRIKEEEIIFKEPSGLILGPAPAILEAINTYVIVDGIPEVYLKEILNYIIPKKTKKTKKLKDNAVTYQEKQNHIPPVPKRKKSKRISHQDSNDESEFYEIKYEENRIIPSQDVVHKQQAVEVGRVSISTTNTELFYDCNSLDYEDIHFKIDKNNINTLDVTKIPKEFKDDPDNAWENINGHQKIIDQNEEYHQLTLIEEPTWKPQEILFKFYLNIEKNIEVEEYEDPFMNQRWSPEITHKEYNQLTLIEEPTWKPQEIFFQSNLNTEKNIEIEYDDPFINQRWSPETTRKEYNLTLIEEPTWKPQEILFESINTEKNIEIEYDDPFISSDSEDDLNQCFNDYAVIEPVSPSFQVSKEKIKFDLNNTYGGVEEEVILDDKVSSSSEDDVFEKRTDRKVNFDFGNSYCTTYEPVSQPASSNTSLSSTTTDEDLSYQLYLDAPPAYRDVTSRDDIYNQKDSVYKNFQVSLEHIQKKHSIYENIQGMDLALLNCKNGYKETITEDDEFSESESIDFDLNRDQKFQNYYDNIGDFKSDTPKEEIQRKYSISEIEDDLMEIKKLDDVVTQIDRIQDVMHKIHLQIDDLESKEDENYTSLLKTLLNSMKILGNLNCNFDEELLKFQQDTMEQITECIKSLKEL